MFTEAAQRLDVRRQEAASRRLWVGAFTAGPQLGSGSVRVQFTAWEGSPPRDCWSGALDRALGNWFLGPTSRPCASLQSHRLQGEQGTFVSCV